ncbi:hypothetical protein BU14_0268s0039 [Porphyra umbilicalis]|uniref:Endonuclease/exonuclease/phosphatase domain-containing protein n=1 Tax=Porphyra umbilicalis TaxID=2786 RepID=A0A1X6P1R0_PORUM|nr:hypothetical protein BU14_0268s0039 [Porphyra umbilicalis]|eukprot:OSX74798.1 hypothetical protein BU14_0268s0039 [Porphyra umbilicalis]
MSPNHCDDEGAPKRAPAPPVLRGAAPPPTVTAARRAWRRRARAAAPAARRPPPHPTRPPARPAAHGAPLGGRHRWATDRPTHPPPGGAVDRPSDRPAAARGGGPVATRGARRPPARQWRRPVRPSTRRCLSRPRPATAALFFYFFFFLAPAPPLAHHGVARPLLSGRSRPAPRPSRLSPLLRVTQPAPPPPPPPHPTPPLLPRAPAPPDAAVMALPTHLTVATFNLLAPCYKRMTPAAVAAATADEEGDAGDPPPEQQRAAADGVPAGTAAAAAAAADHHPDRPTASTPWPSRPRRPREGDAPALWRPRLAALVGELGALDPPPDVLCLQEWWFDPPYADALAAALGGAYTLTTARRPGKDDGLAVAVRRPLGIAAAASWRLVDGDDRVALLVAIAAPPAAGGGGGGSGGGGGGGGAVAPSPSPLVVIVNTHLTFPHGVGDGVMRLQQVAALTDVVDGWVNEAARREAAPVLVVGDFNGEADDAVAAHLVARDYVNCWEALRGRGGGGGCRLAPAVVPATTATAGTW